jgi:hypothetical protein
VSIGFLWLQDLWTPYPTRFSNAHPFLAKLKLISKQAILPEIDRPQCQIAWADAAINNQPHGWDDDRAINILSAALNNWPSAMDSLFGPASRDYFRLRLGIWYDLRGASDVAESQINQLASGPTDSKYDLPSRLAKIYLQYRQKNGFVGACSQVEQAWSDARGAFEGQWPPSYDLGILR